MNTTLETGPISLNISDEPGRPLRPELLLHPTIPLYLHGVNPRTILGKEWWDVTRKEAYRKNNFCCWACGIFQLDTPSGRLDAHECYEYDTSRYEARLVEVVALCRECHKFIHWRGLVRPSQRKKIILRGIEILRAARLPLPEGQVKWLQWWIPTSLELRELREDRIGLIKSFRRRKIRIKREMPQGVRCSNKWKLIPTWNSCR